MKEQKRSGGLKRGEIRWSSVLHKVFGPLLWRHNTDNSSDESNHSSDHATNIGETTTQVVMKQDVKEEDIEIEKILALIRDNLPPDVELRTPFGVKRLCYADYTASGRPLAFIEEYMTHVVGPLFGNTHTETSATGLQTTHFREEARHIIMESVGANQTEHVLVFAGSGMTGAMEKFVQMLGIHVPSYLRSIVEDAIPLSKRPLVLISESEHHSNELVWRENYVELIVIRTNDAGHLCMEHLEKVLAAQREADRLQEHGEGRRQIIGSFTAASNVTGLRNDFFRVSKLLHQYGALSCWDFAAAGPYVDINMGGNGVMQETYLDAVILSPHKFVGGPGSPGVLVARTDCFKELLLNKAPPTMPGGGTVQVVWSEGAVYDDRLDVREEAGTPNIMGSIRCGLAFHIRNMVGAKRIEELEGNFARRAVLRLKSAGAWVMGDSKTNIVSDHMRLSITSFNVPFSAAVGVEPTHHAKLKNKFLHPHFVCQILNDLYGIQSRSGCSCAGPLSFRLFRQVVGDGFDEAVVKETMQGFHAFKPGWARVNFNYFISEEEFDFLCTAIEQVLQHGWKLLPLYALCLRTGQYMFVGTSDDTSIAAVEPSGKTHTPAFNKFDAVRLIKEIKLSKDRTSLEWVEPHPSRVTRKQQLDEAMETFNQAPELVRHFLHRVRDLNIKSTDYPSEMEPFRYFLLASEVLPFLGITDQDVENAVQDAPNVLETTTHPSATPAFTAGHTRH